MHIRPRSFKLTPRCLDSRQSLLPGLFLIDISPSPERFLGSMGLQPEKSRGDVTITEINYIKDFKLNRTCSPCFVFNMFSVLYSIARLG